MGNLTGAKFSAMSSVQHVKANFSTSNHKHSKESNLAILLDVG